MLLITVNHAQVRQHHLVAEIPHTLHTRSASPIPAVHLLTPPPSPHRWQPAPPGDHPGIPHLWRPLPTFLLPPGKGLEAGGDVAAAVAGEGACSQHEDVVSLRSCCWGWGSSAGRDVLDPAGGRACLRPPLGLCPARRRRLDRPVLGYFDRHSLLEDYDNLTKSLQVNKPSWSSLMMKIIGKWSKHKASILKHIEMDPDVCILVNYTTFVPKYSTFWNKVSRCQCLADLFVKLALRLHVVSLVYILGFMHPIRKFHETIFSNWLVALLLVYK